MSPALKRYLLFQLPGWIIALVLGYAAVHYWDFKLFYVAALWVVWILKDFILFPIFRHAYHPTAGSDIRPVGEVGQVVEELDPQGRVRVSGESWKARSLRNETLKVGTKVKVVDRNDLLLLVQSLD